VEVPYMTTEAFEMDWLVAVVSSDSENPFMIE
jgi:hypothetical protein